MERNREVVRKRNYIAFLIIALLVLIIASLMLGAVNISMKDLFGIFNSNKLTQAKRIILYIRLPRVIAAVVAGAGLAMAGAIIQVILHNPLAGPNIIGVNSGAEFAVVLSSLFFPNAFGVYPVFALIGAFLTVILVYIIGKKAGASRLTIVLAGVAINSLLSGFSNAIYSISEGSLITGNAFKIGGLASVNILVLKWASVLICISILVTILFGKELEIFSLGDEMAKTLGLKVKSYRFFFMILAAALAGASVSIIGIVGFVGLMSPHIVRILFGTEDVHFLAGSALTGALLLLICDLIGRCLFKPYEISVGIILSIIGAPFFLWMLLSKQRRQ